MKLYVPLTLGLLLTTAARAETCTDLTTCAKLMHDFKGHRYIWDVKMNEYKFASSPSVEMTADNAELIFTSLLDHVGLARLPVGDGKTYRVVRNVMMKEIEAPVVEASADRPPEFPSNTWDWVTMRYRVKSPEAAPVIESAYRLHMPREGRMQADENSGFLIVTGSIPTVRQMYKTIQAADANARASYKQWRDSTFMSKEKIKALGDGPKN
jgi:hypothetical protein